MQPSLDQLFATHCAPALAGVAPANLISLRRGDFPHLEEELRKYQQAFARRGVKFDSLCSCANRELILVYRPQLMAQALNRDGVEEILTPCGYDLSRPVEEILAHLGLRVRQGGSFPHEIGLFLGYPVEDVVGFIENQGQNFKLCGPWKRTWTTPPRKWRRTRFSPSPLRATRSKLPFHSIKIPTAVNTAVGIFLSLGP